MHALLDCKGKPEHPDETPLGHGENVQTSHRSGFFFPTTVLFTQLGIIAPHLTHLQTLGGSSEHTLLGALLSK